MTPKSFHLETANGPLRGDVFLPENPRGLPVVVGLHGFKGFKDWGFWPELGQRFAAAELALVTFNISGSGIGEDLQTASDVDGFERNTIAKELQDLGRILDAVTQRELPIGSADVRKLGLLGHSRGGGVSILRAGRDPRVRSLVTWASVATFYRYTDEQRDMWRRVGSVPIENSRTGQVFQLRTDLLDDLESHPDAYDIEAAAARLKIPYLIVHGTRDETVPVEEAELIARGADRSLTRSRLIEGGGHTFGAVHPFRGSPPELERAIDATITWFRDSLL